MWKNMFLALTEKRGGRKDWGQLEGANGLGDRGRRGKFKDQKDS